MFYKDKEKRLSESTVFFEIGIDLFFQAVTRQVSSVFGMGTGGS